MREVGKLCAKTHEHLTKLIRPGITTLELDTEAEIFIRTNGALPSFKGYRGYTNTICTAVNNQVVHTKPTNYVLKDGDIVTVDIGACMNGFHGDTAKTHMIGNVHPDIQAFVHHGYLALHDGIDKAIDGNYVGDISNAIAKSVRQHGYGIVTEFVGHGIGRNIHEDPQIENIEVDYKGAKLANGMVICIEPILTMNPSGKIKIHDQWNVVTEDGCPSVHWEHVVAITPSGPEILTLREEEYK
jgi:methionyl aminopeptidase